eukprot:TRINITY_DN11889_c0_g1_i8.p1 TRINITY_DN11889_c0_g1~~TRINITY_DN11889_c0_g1_i8.p1  ORF type:complete len:1063 (+),score=149.18 TRINITY_DN11889_c0_g1_i8:72-3260(+)
MTLLQVPIVHWTHQKPRLTITAFEYHRDQQKLVCGTMEGAIMLWKATENSNSGSLQLDVDLQAILLGHESRVLSLASCLVEWIDSIASLAEDGTICVWDLLDGRCLKRHSNIIEGPLSMASVPPKKRYVACSTKSGYIDIIDISYVQHVRRIPEFGDWIDFMSWTLSPHQENAESNVLLLATASSGVLKMRRCSDQFQEGPNDPTSPEFGSLLVEFELPEQHTIAFNTHTDGHHILIVFKHSLQLYNISSKIPLFEAKCPSGSSFKGCQFESDIALLWTKNAELFYFPWHEKVAVQELSLRRLNIPFQGDAKPQSLEYSAGVIWAVLQGGKLHAFRIGKPSENTVIIPVAQADPWTSWLPIGGPTVTSSSMFTLDGCHAILEGYSDGSFVLRDLSGKDPELRILSKHSVPVTSVALLVALRQDTKSAIIGHLDGTVAIWDLDARTQSHSAKIFDSEVVFIDECPSSNHSFSLHGCFFAIGANHSMCIIDGTSGRLVRQMIGHSSAILEIHWRPHDGYVHVECEDGNSYLWQLQTGCMERYFSGTQTATIRAQFHSLKSDVDEISATHVPFCSKIPRRYGLATISSPSSALMDAITVFISKVCFAHVTLFNLKKACKILRPNHFLYLTNSADATQQQSAQIDLGLLWPMRYLLPWGLDDSYDAKVTQVLGLSPLAPSCNISFGIRGDYDTLTLLVPSTNSQKPNISQWMYSPYMSGVHALCSVGLSNLVIGTLGDEEVHIKPLMYRTVTEICTAIPERFSTYVFPSLPVLMRSWHDTHEDVQYTANTLTKTVLFAMKPNEQLDLLCVWQRRFPVPAAVFAVAAMINHLPHVADDQALVGRVAMLLEEFLISSIGYRAAMAGDLIAKGFPIMKKYLKSIPAIQRQLFILSSLQMSQWSSACSQAFQTISNFDPASAIASLSWFLSRDRQPTKEQPAAINTLTRAVKSFPPSYFYYVPHLVDAILQPMGSECPARESCLPSVTLFIHQIIKIFPNISFHAATQRLAVGTREKIVLVYDLKTANRIHTIEGHTEPVTCVCFSNDGKMVASYSLVIYSAWSSFLASP